MCKINIYLNWVRTTSLGKIQRSPLDLGVFINLVLFVYIQSGDFNDSNNMGLFDSWTYWMDPSKLIY